MRFRFRNASSKFQIQSNTAAIESVSDSLPDVVKYIPGVRDSTQLPSDHGGLGAGTTAAALKDKTMTEMFDLFLFPTIDPIRTDAAVGLTASLDALCEIGQVVVFTLNTTATDGHISLNGITQSSIWAGSITSAVLLGDFGSSTLNFSGTTSIDNFSVTHTVIEGVQSATLSVTWGQGPMPLDSTGADFPSIQCPNGYTKSAVKSLTGVYPIYIGTSSGFQAHPLVVHTANNISFTQNYNESTTLHHRVSIPDAMLSGRALSIQTLNILSGNFEAPSVNNWVSSSEMRGGVGYTLYTKSGSAGGANSYNLLFV